MKQKVLEFVEGLVCNYEVYEESIKELEDEHDKVVDDLLDEVNRLEDAKRASEKALKEALAKPEGFHVGDLREWYYDKYGRQNSWKYNAYSTGLVEVSQVMRSGDDDVVRKAANELIRTYKLTRDNTPEEVIESVIRYFMKSSNWTYKTDLVLHNRREYWQSASRGWSTREGDCDSLAILMHNLVYFMFEKLDMSEHYWRLKFTAMGTVVEAHAFNIWLGRDGEWYVVESTLDLRGSFMKTWLRTPLKNNNLYTGQPWGFADRVHSWKGSIVSLRPYENDG